MPVIPDRNCTHLAGEYFVAAELYKRGYSVAITIGNAKAIDLYAEMGTKTVNVQVKAIRVRKNVGWPIMKNKIVPNVIYVFVCLNEPGTIPSYYILTSSDAKSKVKQYKTRGIIDLHTINSEEYLENWGKIERALKK